LFCISAAALLGSCVCIAMIRQRPASEPSTPGNDLSPALPTAANP
jgi:hypothetical protein